jgi:predicted ATPase/DNA-binding SARP family transcriptional activator
VLRVGILGPVEVTTQEAMLPVDTSKERAVLCVLALQARETVSPDAIVDAIWGDHPPPTAIRTLGSHISRLRGLIGTETIHGDSRGYRLDIDPLSVDALRLESLIDEATVALATGRPEVAGARASEALGLWRGDPLGDLADGPTRQGERARLEELHALAAERQVEAELALGKHDRVVGDLESLIARYPLREELWGHLMLALYRSGRQADALRAFERLRQTLRDEVGLEPAPSICRIEHQILHQDPQLDLVPPPPPHNLPAAASSFVGRGDDIRRVAKALHEHRLVTLVGPGGVGKTRLALQVAGEFTDSFGDGVLWVDLASVRDPIEIAVRLAGDLNVTAPAGGSVETAILAFIRRRELLLVFDNCEHLAEPVSELIERMLEAGPAVTVLATSRERLASRGEFRYPVAPMSTPEQGPSDRDLLMFDAVRLFIERAADSSSPTGSTDLKSVAEICRQLDGLPLAIELVAARTTFLTPAEILTRLRNRLDAVTDTFDSSGSADHRHGSLRAVLDWGHALLGPHEQNLLARLSVFPAAFELAAAEAVAVGAGCPPDEIVDVLGQLVDASMIDVVTTSETCSRFRLLDTVREYAAEWLDEAAGADALQRHANHYRQLAKELGPEIDGPHGTDALDRLRRDDANMRAAVAWSLAHDGRTVSLDFGRALGHAWYVSGDLAGCVRLLETLLDGADQDDAQRGWCTFRLVWPLLLSGDVEQAWAALDRAMELADETGDINLARAVLWARGHTLLLGLGDTDAAIPFYEQVLDISGSTGTSYARLDAQLGMAQALILADRSEGVGETLDEVQPILLITGDDNRLAHNYLDRALLAWCVGDITAIPDLAQAGCRHARKAQNTHWEQINLVALGTGHLLTGSLDDAETALFRAARLALDDGNLLQLGVALQALAALAAVLGDGQRAARLLGAGTTLAPFWPLMKRGLGPYRDLAREDLGEGFDAGFELGRSLGPAEAVTLALNTPSS